MDGRYLWFTLVPMAFGFFVQFRLKSTVRKWMRVKSASGTTGEEAATKILQATGIGDKVEVKFAQGGALSDHYNPGDKSVNLSKPVHDKTSIASNAIAAHECGHALQDEYGGGMYKVRSFMWPIVSLASSSWVLILIGGTIFNATGWITFALVLYLVTVLFQIVTLPVEFNASFGNEKALDQLLANGLLTEEEIPGARKVLRAAAMTYVAGALAAVSQALFFFFERQESQQRRSAIGDRLTGGGWDDDRDERAAPKASRSPAPERQREQASGGLGEQMTRAATSSVAGAAKREVGQAATKAAKRTAGKAAGKAVTRSLKGQLLGRR